MDHGCNIFLSVRNAGSNARRVLRCAYQPALCLSNCIPAGITSPMPVLRLQSAEVASRSARSYVRFFCKCYETSDVTCGSRSAYRASLVVIASLIEAGRCKLCQRELLNCGKLSQESWSCFLRAYSALAWFGIHVDGNTGTWQIRAQRVRRVFVIRFTGRKRRLRTIHSRSVDDFGKAEDAE